MVSAPGLRVEGFFGMAAYNAEPFSVILEVGTLLWCHAFCKGLELPDSEAKTPSLSPQSAICISSL